MTKPLKCSDLTTMYTEADNAHRSLFAEQQSNLYLVAGHHYTRKGPKFWDKFRNSTQLSKTQKLRLTQNHIQKITKTYVNNILGFAPGVQIVPKNKSEYSDQKAAELHNSVWYDMKERHNLKRLFHTLARDYVEVGEAWVKIFFDPAKGQFLTYEIDRDSDGTEHKSKDGHPVVPARFTGDVVFERYLGFDVRTDPAARSWDECRYVILDKMVDAKDLREQFEDDEYKLKKIHESQNTTYQLFEGYGSYKSSEKKQVLVSEFYFRPCPEYPNGYYYIKTGDVILFEGELPHGIFPVIHVGFDEASTSARSFSIIKQLRPPQAEINRCISRIVEHHLTLGDDKLVTQPGATVSAGATTHGIKVIKVSGQVTHLPGRDGGQFRDHLNSQISALYQIANVAEDSSEKANNVEPYTMLFRSMRQKKAFSIYGEKWESFTKQIAKTALEYAKNDYSAEMVIQIIDKKERVNIKEFKNSDDLSYEIAVESVSDDIETQMGRQISIDHILQYAGQSLSPEDIGQVIRSMPFVNQEELLTDRTIDYDNVKSDILSMDRGEFIPANPMDNHQYYVRKLTHRMKLKDFQFLPKPVQSNYLIKLEQHEQYLQQQMQDAAAASSGFIPSGGFLVTTDIRVPKADDPTKTERAKVPVEALAWLIDKLEKQGQSQALFQSLPPSAQAQMGVAMAQQQAPAGPPMQ